MTRMFSFATTTRVAVPGALPGGTVRGDGMLARAAGLLLAWQDRAFQRHSLGQLDARLLADIDVAPAHAAAESIKPFWRN